MSIMFHSEERDYAIERMNKANTNLQRKNKTVLRYANSLHFERGRLKDSIDQTWTLLNSFRNKPESLNVKLERVKFQYDRYQKLLDEIEGNSDELAKVYGGALSTALFGTGVAALGPTALVSFATTFGTASTGTAISALSGAAADSAILAWLGGGAVAVGGGGTAVGSTLLSLAGPIGWTIAATSVIGGGLIASGKNKKAIAQANEATKKIHAQIKVISGTIQEIGELERQTRRANSDLKMSYRKIDRFDREYGSLTEEEQDRLQATVNNVSSFVELLDKKVGQ